MRLSGATKNPATSTTTASSTATKASSGNPRPTPSSATATSPAAISPRQRVTSMRSRTKPSSAGSSVTAAIIVTPTVTAAPIASPVMNDSPISSIPSSEIITVRPAKITARPAVSIAVRVACSGVLPASRPSR